MWLYIFFSFALFLISVVLVMVSFAESNRDDVMIIDDAVDRERVERLLKLPEESRCRIDKEVTAEIESGNYD